MAGAAGIKAGRAFIIIGALDKTGMILRKVSARLTAFGQRMQNVGRRMVMAFLGAGVPAALATRVFVSYDDAMRKVEARTEGTAEEMKALRNQVKLLGRTTSFTATQIANLQAKLAQKGFSRPQIKAMTADVLNLARAAGEGGEEDTVLAADLISGTIKAFKMEAKDATRIADIFTTTVNSSNFSLMGLVDAMSKAGPLAKDYGLSIEETAATLASMTNVNIQASEAGTAMISFLARMSKSEFTGSFNKGLQKLTGTMVTFRDESGNLRKPLEIIDEIGRKTKRLGSGERGDLLSVLFGVRQFGKATGAAGGAVDAFKLLEKLQTQAQGSADKTAKKMDAGLGGAFRILMSAIEGVNIAIGEALEKTFKNAGETITDMIGRMTKWIEANGQVIVTVIKVVALVGAVGVGLMALSLVLGVVAKVVGLVGVAFTVAMVAAKAFWIVATSPALLMVAAITAVLAVVAKLAGAFDGMGKRLSGMGDTIGKTFGGIGKAMEAGNLTAAWDILVTGLEILWLQFVDAIKTVWENFTSDFKLRWVRVTTSIVTAWLKVRRLLVNSISSLNDRFANLSLQFAGGAKQAAALKRASAAIRKDRDTQFEKALKKVQSDSLKKQLGIQGKINNAQMARTRSIEKLQKHQASVTKEMERQIRASKAIGKLASGTGIFGGITAELDKVKPTGKEIAGGGIFAQIMQVLPEDFVKKNFKKVKPVDTTTTLLRGLQSGTVEAAQKAHQNAQVNLQQEAVDIAADQLAEQKITNDKLDNMEGGSV